MARKKSGPDRKCDQPEAVEAVQQPVTSLDVITNLVHRYVTELCNAEHREYALPQWKEQKLEAQNIPVTTRLKDLGLGQIDIVEVMLDMEEHVRRSFGVRVQALDDEVQPTDTIEMVGQKVHNWFKVEIPPEELVLTPAIMPMAQKRKR